MRSQGTVLSINTGESVEAPWAGRRGRTAIDKKSVGDSAFVGPYGIESDEQATDFHGGLLQALYAYAREDLDWWAEQLGRPLRNGLFGENLDLEGFDVSNAALAEQWQVGDAVVEVSAPRIACGTFGGWMGEKGWAKRFNGTKRPGAYLRVLRAGVVRTGDPVRVTWEPETRIPLSAVADGILGDHGILQQVVDLAEENPHWDVSAVLPPWRSTTFKPRPKTRTGPSN
ncbi:MOSC domain-containing protein [Micromonospora parva]|uniref:MOSC domain-containing protein n=1 Tax=Micromonospora parva TaxID=1464048 RepID=UPI0034083A8D